MYSLIVDCYFVYSISFFYFLFFFFFKQKTAYEMRISDWSSDVCSSDLKLPGTLWKDNLMAHGTARIGKDHYRTEIEVGGHALVGDEGPGLGGKKDRKSVV